MHVPVNPDAKVYLVALLLALASGFLFGAVPVRQILRTNPYEVVKAGSTGIIAGSTGRRITLRDVLLVVQIAICAVLVTSSLVAVRGLVRSMHSNFGFEPQNAMLVDTTLGMAGYSGDRVPAMQRRMIEALAGDSRREVSGIRESNPSGRRRGDRGCLHRPDDGFEDGECRGQRADVTRYLPNTFMRRAHRCWPAGTFLAGRQELAARGGGERVVCAQDLRLGQQRAGQVLTRPKMGRASRWWASWKTESTIR